MNKSHSLVIGVSIVLGCLTIGLALNSPAVAQPAQYTLPGGKFQFVVTADNRIFVLDTITGQSWWRTASPENSIWRTLGSPWFRRLGRRMTTISPQALARFNSGRGLCMFLRGDLYYG